MVFTDIDSTIGITVRTEVRGINFTGKDEADNGKTIVTAGPTQTQGYASAPEGEIETTHSGISNRPERSWSNDSGSPDRASAVKKVEERYDRLISAQRKQRYNLGCDKGAKQARTQACQDVSLQIRLLEEGREKELAKTDRQYRRATVPKLVSKTASKKPTPQVCDAGSKFNLARDRKAIEDVLSSALDSSECLNCQFYGFKNIEKEKSRCGQIKLAVTYTMNNVWNAEINQRSREIRLSKRNNKIDIEDLGKLLKK